MTVKGQKEVANGKNGNGSIAAYLPNIIGTMTVLIVLIGGFWSVANPKDDLRKLDERIDRIDNRQREGLAIISRHDEIIRRTMVEQDRRTDAYVRTDKYTDAHQRLERDITKIQLQLDSAFPTTKLFDQINDRLRRLEDFGRSAVAQPTAAPIAVAPVTVVPTRP